MFTSAKRKQQKQIRQLQCQEKCIDHIPYYLSGLSRAQFFRQPFSKQLYPKEAFISLLKVRSQRFILRDNKPYHKIAKTRAWLVHHVERKNKCVCLYKRTGSAINHAVLPSPGRTSPPKDISSTPLGGGGKFHNILFYFFFIVILFKKLLEVYSFALYQDLVHLLLTVYFQQSSSSFAWKEEAVGRGVLPY